MADSVRRRPCLAWGIGFGVFNGRGVAALCLFIIVLAAMSLPALAASPITGVTVTPATASVNSGQAIYVRATVQGSGDFDHRVTWSLSPLEAGTLSPTGLFISDPAFNGSASVKATSRENPQCSGTTAITVAAGGGVVHVDHNNAGLEDGTALRPFRTIQGPSIKPWMVTPSRWPREPTWKTWSYPGICRSAPGRLQRGHHRQTTPPTCRATSSTAARIMSPGSVLSKALPGIRRWWTWGNWAPAKALTYAVDGFTLTGGFHGIQVAG